jgi:putative transposase
MAQAQDTAVAALMEQLIAEGPDGMAQVFTALFNLAMRLERERFLGAGLYERSPERRGYANGYKPKRLDTAAGTITVEVPKTAGAAAPFYPQSLERGRRSSRAVLLAVAEMYVQGVSTRKVKAITEELCGHSFSAATISTINKALDETLTKFARRRLTEDYPYLILDARYEKVREDGVIQSQAVLIALGINWEGHRQVLGVELANRESQSSWREFLVALKQRGLSGVEFVVSDDHAGLKKAIAEILPEAAWQRCYVHFLRNALDYLPRKADEECMQELRWLYHRRSLAEAQRDLAAWLTRWQAKYAKLTDWVEEEIGSTLSFYRLPRQHHKHLKSSNMLERLNEEVRRRTYVVRIFPNAASCLRLVRALCAETHEAWIEDKRYINMELLREERKEQLRQAA